MRKFSFEGVPFIIALVLGPMFECSFCQLLQYVDPLTFFKRSLHLIVLMVSFRLVFFAAFPRIAKRRKKPGEALRVEASYWSTLLQARCYWSVWYQKTDYRR